MLKHDFYAIDDVDAVGQSLQACLGRYSLAYEAASHVVNVDEAVLLCHHILDSIAEVDVGIVLADDYAVGGVEYGVCVFADGLIPDGVAFALAIEFPAYATAGKLLFGAGDVHRAFVVKHLIGHYGGDYGFARCQILIELKGAYVLGERIVSEKVEAKAEAGEKSLLHIIKPEIDFDPIISLTAPGSWEPIITKVQSGWARAVFSTRSRSIHGCMVPTKPST